MTRRLRLLAAWMALSVATLPVVPRLHLLFVAHRHVFCVEHGDLEHVLHGSPSGHSAASATEHRSPLWSPGKADARDFGNHRPCQASATAAPFCIDKAPNLASPALNTTVVSGCLCHGFRPVAILRLAPKQSPPRHQAS